MKTSQILITIVIAVIAAFAVVRLAPTPNSNSVEKAVLKDSVFERVMRTGVLRCAYTPYSVGLMKDPNTGKMSGIYYDIINTLANNLDLKVEWVEEVGWAEQIQGMQTNRYDLICSPTCLNSIRTKAADFSIPIYYSPVHIWAKADNMSIAYDLKNLNSQNIKIATLDGEQTTAVAKQFFPQAQQVSLPQSSPFSDLMIQVSMGKADVVFLEPVVVQEFIKQNPNSLRRVSPLDNPLMVVNNVILLPQGEYKFKQLIDNGLRDMLGSKMIDKILDKYEPAPDSYIRASGMH